MLNSSQPYEDNILIQACGPILSPVEIAKRLVYLPLRPSTVPLRPGHLIEHELAGLWRLHIPSEAGIALAQSMGCMMRQGYVHRRPNDAATWRRIYGPGSYEHDHVPVQLAASVMGHSGVGKTTALERALRLYPQVVEHPSFPNLVGPVKQLLWLKIDVPQSGKIRDLAEVMHRATSEALGMSDADARMAGWRRGSSLAHSWLQRVSGHFLGLLVLDEVQNLFKIQTKSVRTAASRANADRPALRIVDDEALKFLLTLSNTSKIPTLMCSTPDGIEALNTRMSTSQRTVTGGFHHIPRATDFNDRFFAEHFVPRLFGYQWMAKAIKPTAEWRRLLFELSGGILRICVALWIHTHRHAIRRGATELTEEDFRGAADGALAPLRPAVRALMSNDPRLLSKYEDLTPGFAMA